MKQCNQHGWVGSDECPTCLHLLALREQYAGLAMQAHIAGSMAGNHHWTPWSAARDAVEAADLLLQALHDTPSPTLKVNHE